MSKRLMSKMATLVHKIGPYCKEWFTLGAVETAKVHDYRRRYWGHDYTLRPDPNPTTARITGWGYGLKAGHYFLLAKAGNTFVYRFTTLSYFSDPPDMWTGTVEFVNPTQIPEDLLPTINQGSWQ